MAGSGEPSIGSAAGSGKLPTVRGVSGPATGSLEKGKHSPSAPEHRPRNIFAFSPQGGMN